ncbi:MAG TPA: hypothetical protein VLI41_02390 [Phenylobacterium sp.]|uniref:hypothetical protein n=1 Tax=Phenylobacterium sp. TaxID=1871053 RepID=UPI002B7232E3|nr:hypothetical protein [Phenylobacterium sp.]HSV02029.1 hypothetical protein [Phenylobacterium sp.]
MQARTILAISTSLALLGGPALASDHLFTAVGAGGLTTSSQPFQNGTTNPGRPGTLVPGQGSPLSGEDHTTPAVETGSLLTHHFTQPNLNANPGNGTLRTPLPVTRGQMAPSAHSPH